MEKNKNKNKEVTWENLLSSASRLQKIIPGAVLVGGSATALHTHHRVSFDADHIVSNLKEQFNKILEELESVAGWETARIKPPVLILGSLDGVDTGIRQLIRKEPLETETIEILDRKITVPTMEEILRIKGALILQRNATRDYLDFAVLSDGIGNERTCHAMEHFDQLYPQKNEKSALMQLQVQLAHPLPYDLEDTDLSTYKNLQPKWHDWKTIEDICIHTSQILATELEAGIEQPPLTGHPPRHFPAPYVL
ncbi:hypothetical protein FACS1894187_19300 [Synergistales bacterium]|nr:hypothetical protein FACS1894187_19300 [Synergistales bacterium]